MKISVTRHRVGVNMGDHGETVVTAHEVAPDEDVAELAVRLLVEEGFGRDVITRQSFDNFLTIRLVEEAPKPEPEPNVTPNPALKRKDAKPEPKPGTSWEDLL